MTIDSTIIVSYLIAGLLIVYTAGLLQKHGRLTSLEGAQASLTWPIIFGLIFFWLIVLIVGCLQHGSRILKAPKNSITIMVAFSTLLGLWWTIDATLRWIIDFVGVLP